MTILHRIYSSSMSKVSNLAKFCLLLAILNASTVLFSLDRSHSEESNKQRNVSDMIVEKACKFLDPFDALQDVEDTTHKVTENDANIVNSMRIKKKLDASDCMLLKDIVCKPREYGCDNDYIIFWIHSDFCGLDDLENFFSTLYTISVNKKIDKSLFYKRKDSAIKDLCLFALYYPYIATDVLKPLYERSIIDFDPRAYIWFNYKKNLVEESVKLMEDFLETVLWKEVCFENLFNTTFEQLSSSDPRPCDPEDKLKSREDKIAMLMPSIESPLQAKASPVFKARERVLNKIGTSILLPEGVLKMIWELEGYTIIPINEASLDDPLSRDSTEEAEELKVINRTIVSYLENDLPKKNFIDSLEEGSSIYNLVKENGGDHTCWYLVAFVMSKLSTTSI